MIENISIQKILLLTLIYFILTFVFTVSWWHGTIIRSLFVAFWFSPNVSLNTTQFSALWNRVMSLIIFGKKKMIDYKTWFIFLIMWILTWLSATYLLIIINEEKLKFTFWIVLIIWFFGYFIKKKINIKKYIPQLSNFTKKIIWFIILYFSETISTIIWWWAIVSNFVLIKYFGKTQLEASAIRKFGWIFKHLISAISLTIAGYFNFYLLLFIIPAWLLWTYLWTHYFIKKWNNFIEIMLVWLSLWLWIYLVFF